MCVLVCKSKVKVYAGSHQRALRKSPACVYMFVCVCVVCECVGVCVCVTFYIRSLAVARFD